MLVQQKWAHVGIFIGVFNHVFQGTLQENLPTLPTDTSEYFWILLKLPSATFLPASSQPLSHHTQPFPMLPLSLRDFSSLRFLSFSPPTVSFLANMMLFLNVFFALPIQLLASLTAAVPSAYLKTLVLIWGETENELFFASALPSA